MRAVGLVRTLIGVGSAALMLAACGAPAPDGGDNTPSSFVATRIPPTLSAPLFSEARAVITRDNAPQLAYLGRLDPPPPVGTIFAYAVSPDATRLAGMTNEVLAVWDLLTGQLVFQTSRYDATAIYFSPDKLELYLIVPDLGGVGLTVIVLDADTGAEQTRFRAHDSAVIVTYFPDDGWLAVGGVDGSIRVWDPAARLSLVTIDPPAEPTADAVSDLPADAPDRSVITGMVFLPDGEHLAAADGARVRLWRWRDRSVAAEQPLDAVAVLSVAASPDGAQIALGTAFGAQIWTPGGDPVLRSLDTGGSAEIVAFAPSGSRLLAGGGTSGLTLWDTTSFTLVGLLPDVGGSRVSATFTQDALLVTTMLNAELEAITGTVALWDSVQVTQGTIARADLAVGAPILRADWTSDGRLLLLFSTSGPVYLWGIP